MSRGFRGGRGRGGFGRGGPMGMMGRGEKGEAGREPPKHAGMLYPPLDDNALPILPGPSDEEDRIYRYSLDLYRTLEKGVDIPGVGESGELSAPWRIEGGRKTVGIEIEQTRYSDRWDDPLNVRPSALMPPHPSTSSAHQPGPSTTPAASGSKFYPRTMYMDESMFPGCLWRGYLEDEGVDKGVKRPEKRRKRDPDEESLPGGGAEDEDQASARSSEPEEDFDFDDDEEDHQDYDHNYFDNGEGDDDEGGDDDERSAGGFDD